MLQIISYVVIAIAIALLIHAAVYDLRNFAIRNSLVGFLLLLYLLHIALMSRWSNVPYDIGLAAMTFAIMLVFYALGLLGAGDVKLLTVAFLWVGWHGAMEFALLLVATSIFLLIAALTGLVESRKVGSRHKVAFAPAIAGALACAFLLGLVQPWPWDALSYLSSGKTV
jgi:prepilin peptidase CpaA